MSLQDGCAAIVTSLAKDICNQRSYRSRRRSEIFRLKKTLQDMDKKVEFQESQVDYYDQYLKTCLANLHVARKKKVHFKTPSRSVSFYLFCLDLRDRLDFQDTFKTTLCRI